MRTRADQTRVLIAGGGVAALEAALALRALAEERVSVELVGPEPHFWYRPLSVAEPFELGEAQSFELSKLALAAGATFSLGTLMGVDSKRHEAHTSVGDLPYDVLLIACGATPTPALPGALTFRGPADADKIRALLAEIVAGTVRRVAFVVPSGAVWSLPIYELALMTAAYVQEHQIEHAEITLVTPEDQPLGLFGDDAADAVRELLDERRIAVRAGTHAAEIVAGELRFIAGGHCEVDRVVALPRLHGPGLDGVPQNLDGFIPVDNHGRVRGLADVFAAGDITSFPVKQGGIAAQQAYAVAEFIAAGVDAKPEPKPFRPVLRGLLLTGRQPRYLRHELTGGSGPSSSVSPEPLWWPPGKIVGRYLAPFLASVAGVDPPAAPKAPGLPVEIDVDMDAMPGFSQEARRTNSGPGL